MTLTGLPIFFEEILMSAVIVFFMTLIYKFLINQNELRELREKIKEKQANAKEVQKTNPEEYKRITTEMLLISNKQMRFTMKPMLASLIIFLAVSPLLGELYGDRTINLIENNGNFTLDGKTYSLELNNQSVSLDGVQCKIPCDEQTIGNYKWNILYKEDDKNKQVVLSRIVVLLPFSLPFFENDFGWVMWYVLNSLILSFIFRKALGVEL